MKLYCIKTDRGIACVQGTNLWYQKSATGWAVVHENKERLLGMARGHLPSGVTFEIISTSIPVELVELHQLFKLGGETHRLAAIADEGGYAENQDRGGAMVLVKWGTLIQLKTAYKHEIGQ